MNYYTNNDSIKVVHKYSDQLNISVNPVNQKGGLIVLMCRVDSFNV